MKENTRNHKILYALLLVSLLIRCIFAYYYKGFLTDTMCFAGWASRVYEVGFSNFYSPEAFSDYPPGYMYILYVLGALVTNLQLDYFSGFGLMLLKLPAILCDIVTGYIIFKVAVKHFSSNVALWLCGAYLLNPAVFINSSIWGQVDSVFTLTILIVCILLSKGKTIPAYYVFALGILLKPQTLIFSPLILLGIYEHVIKTDFQWKKFFVNLFHGLSAIACMVLLSLPFGLEKVIQQYSSTLGSYPYISVNAYNFWSLLGLNWASQEKSLLFLSFGELGTVDLLSYAQLGTVVIVVLTLLSAFLFIKRIRQSERYYLTGAFLIITMFLFSVRMHERYVFPGMLMLLLTYIVTGKKAWLNCYIGLSMGHFLNVWHVLYHYDPQNYNATALPIIGISILMVLTGIGFYATIKKDYISPLEPQSSRKAIPFTKIDWIIMLGITLFYACFAFYNLGKTSAPKTEYEIPYYTYLDLSSEDGRPISNLNWYLLNEQDINFSLEVKNTGDADWVYVQDFTMKSVFSWGTLELSEPADSIRITNITEDAVIGEIVITDSLGNVLPVQNSDYYPPLFDETATFPETIDHLSGSYFDEIYYTRTVYEFIHGLPTYENTHPPFGKVLISWSARLLGTTPFGFRFAGALFGVLMLPFMYLLGRNITRNRSLGAFICFLFAFDFMHFTQTRITTIDVFVTFFIILMYYFMERYIHLSFYDTPLKKTWIPLGACGIAFGFGVSSKWTGAYAGAGLAVIFFYQLFVRYREYLFAKASPKGSSHGIAHKHIIRSFRPNTLRTIGFCLLFFVAIPFTIYLLSYLPFVDSYRPGLFERMLKNQETMFNYHSALNATHPYSSTWYEWPTIKRPIFYFSKILEGNMRQGISAFGNPLVWWGGIPAFLYTLYLAIKEKKKTAGFLCIAFLAQYLPWTLVSRCTFIYHYFPSVPFIVLMTGYAFKNLQEKTVLCRKPKIFYSLVFCYALASFVLFLLFYPVLSGSPVSTEYVDKFLRWFDSWVLVIN